MKPGSPPTPPDDESLDPLLTTLRQRLGDYGQAPPPAAWAAIRKRVAPPPLPWWRRPRRLLPLLALLGVLLVGILAQRHGQLIGNQPVVHLKTDPALAEHHTTLAANEPTNANANTSAVGYSANTGATRASVASQPATTGTTTRLATPLTPRRAPMASAAKSAGKLGKRTLATAAGAGLPATQQRQTATTATANARRLTLALPLASNRLRRSPTKAKSATASHELATASPSISQGKTAFLANGRSTRRAHWAAGRTSVAAGEPAAHSQPAASQLATA